MSRNTALLSLFALLNLIAFTADLMLGSIYIPLDELIGIFSGTSIPGDIHHEIALNLRLPKAITAVLTGAALSVCGLMMQTLFRNPLADPYILGVSSGAGLGVAITVMLSSALPAALSAGSGWSMILSATTGALLILLLVVAVSFKVRNVVSLLIIGIMFGTICSSVITVLQNFSNPDSIKLFVMWTFGSLSAVTWNYMRILAPVVLAGCIMAFVLQKRMDALLLGENYAQTLGIPIRRTRFLVVSIAGLLAGAITAFTGPIAFVGVAIPHMARGLFRSASHRILLPACILLGSLLLLVCDIITQIPAYTLPINTVSALFGAPVIIWILIKKS